MATAADRVVLTYEHYLELPNDGNCYEIINGELYVSPAPSIKHQRVSFRLSLALGNHVEAEDRGEVFTAPSDLVLANLSIVQPDLLFIGKGRLGILTDANVQGPPDLVIKIISPSSTKTDQDTKRTLYEQYEVQNYWIFEPLERWVRAYALGADGAYELVAEAYGDETFSAPPFANLAIRLSDIWSA
jgi:Uma2 family endonuclease